MKKIFMINRIKMLCGLLFLFSSLFFSDYVNASVDTVPHSNDYYSDYFMVVNYESGVRFSHFRIYRFFDRPAYAIDFGYNVVKWGYYYTEDYSKFGLSKEQFDYINLIGYYGYEYPTHRNDYNYFVAAQELILDYLLGVDVYWTDVMEKNAKELDFSVYKNRILELVNNHYVLPSFDQDIMEYSIEDEIILIDDNYVLSNYEIIDSGGLSARISDNKILVENNGGNVGYYTLRLKKKSYTDDLAYLYYENESQTLFVPGDIEQLESNVNIEIKGASLTIKWDEISLYNCLEYGLYDSQDKLITNFKVDKNGQFVIDDLALGTYSLKTIDADSQIIYTINIDGSENEFYIPCNVVKKKVEIFKTYGENKKIDANCIFEIIDSNGEVYATEKTDNNGYFSVMLPCGKYFIKQKSSINGYSIIDDVEIVIDVTSNDTITYYLNSDKIIDNPKTYDNINKNIFLFVGCVGFFMIIFVYVVRKYMTF